MQDVSLDWLITHVPEKPLGLMPLKLSKGDWVVIYMGMPIEHAPGTSERIPRTADEESASLMCRMLENEFELARKA